MPRRVTEIADSPPPPRNAPSQEQFDVDMLRLVDLEYTSMRHKTLFGRLKRQHEKNGGDYKKLREVYGRKTKMSPAEIRADIESSLHYARMAKQITWESNGQSSLVDALTAPLREVEPEGAHPKVAAAMAAVDGYNTAKAGGAKDHCQFQAGTEAHQRWMQGFEDFHQDNPDAAATTTVDTSRQRPERAEPEAKAEATPRRRRKAAETPSPVENTGEGAGTIAKGDEGAETPSNEVQQPTTDDKPGWQGDRDFTAPEDNTVTEFPLEARRPRRQAAH